MGAPLLSYASLLNYCFQTIILFRDTRVIQFEPILCNILCNILRSDDTVALMKNLNQYLQKRGGRWHYVRRVPKQYAKIDTRTFIRKSLGTDSLELARKRRDELVTADERYWAQISVGTISADETDEEYKNLRKNYERAQFIATTHGLAFQTMEQIQTGPLDEIVRRVELIENLGKSASLAPKDVTDAVLGNVRKPKVTIRQAFEIYCDTIARSDQLHKSTEQIRNWKKTKKRAVENFVKLNGNVNMDEITREHAHKIYSWWASRIDPNENPSPKSPDSGNKDMGNLNILYRRYWEFEGEEFRDNPFRNLRFQRRKNAEKRPAFPIDWIKTRLLAPESFDGMNADARRIMYALIETGCRPSEVINIEPKNICLDAEIPHLKIRPAKQRALKTLSSYRDIPLVGVSLEAFKASPNGFDRYRDKSTNFSGYMLKMLDKRGLRPTKKHVVYSLRHSFENRLIEANVDQGVRCRLMGHEDNRPEYGDGGSLEFRQAELKRIAFPVLEGLKSKI